MSHKEKIYGLKKKVERLQLENEYIKQLAEKEQEIDTLRKTLVRISNEKASIVDRQNIDYLSFAIQLRHEICEEIRKKAYKQSKVLISCYKPEIIDEFIISEKELKEIEGEK